MKAIKKTIINFINLLKYSPRYIKADKIQLKKQCNDNRHFLIYRYEGLNGLMTQLVCVIGWIKYSLEHNYSLYVDMSSEKTLYSDGSFNSWETFFLQPMVDDVGITANTIVNSYSYAFCPSTVRHNLLYENAYSIISKMIKPKITFPLPRDYKNRSALHSQYCNIFNHYVHYNKETQKYLNEEYDTYLKNKGIVLGILVRGTDYVQNKPFRHPKQPSFDDIVKMINNATNIFKWNYIYLATEEKAISKKMNELYPGKVIENKRAYYDGDYTKQWLYSEIKKDPNSAITSGLQYLSSINLLSKCDMLIGGLCGGTQAALLMNNNKYKYIDLYDEGDYGIE